MLNDIIRIIFYLDFVLKKMEGANNDQQLEQDAADILKRMKELENSTAWK